MASEKLKILVVDDDNSIRGYVARLLSMSGFEAVTAGSGKDAVSQLRSHTDISLVLLDILMPDMDGLETLSEIKKVSKDLPVIMLSALGQTNIIVKAMKAGASDYLVKPFTDGELVKLVTQHLS